MTAMLEASAFIPERTIQNPLFQNWSQAAIKKLLAESTLHVFNEGEIIFKRGEHSTGFYLLHEGVVQLQLCSPNRVIKVFKTLKAGDTLGEAAMLMAKPYRMEAMVLSRVYATNIPKHLYFDYLAQHPELMHSLLAVLSERLYHLLGGVVNTSLQSGTQRVVCYLLGDTALHNGKRVILSSPKAQIAASLNLTPEHFSRILNDLSSRGYIKVEGRHVEFIDIDGLCAYKR